MHQHRWNPGMGGGNHAPTPMESRHGGGGGVIFYPTMSLMQYLIAFHPNNEVSSSLDIS